MVMGEGIWLATVGVGIGLAAASVLTRVLQGQLYGVSRTDPVTFVTVPVLLLVVAAVACVVPIMRALRVDPVTAIRAQE
jgi:putative ABC transport system permease protein